MLALYIESRRQMQGPRHVWPTTDLPQCDESGTRRCVEGITRVVVLADDYNSPIRENHFDFDEIVDTQAMQSPKKPETTQDHDGRSHWVR
jgi:hypothetical protein